ncbi:helix-turn-helix domain-containing protein [Aliivibrio sifiae]|uniref:helix-turn-helix domain-containing protein n=1 Tax=Aliivibrio sifiae TaxID=566293 RepID=UPI003D13DD86
MIFSEFLKEKRLKENLSQKELVCALMLFDETFKTLTIVSLGRWERGVTEPTMKKMLLISKFFNIKWNVFFPRIKVKLSKTKINHFNSWIQHFIQLGLIHNYMGYTSSKPERYIKEIFDYNNPLYLKLNKENINKIINYENKVMGLNHENIINHSSFVKWCDSGNLFNILYRK